MRMNQGNTTNRRGIDAAPGPAGGADAATVSAERAFLSDLRLVLAALNWARYPVLRRMFGVPREQANLLTFVLALSAANATYEVARRFIRHPWPLGGPDTLIAAFLTREAGFGIAGPKVREGQLFGTLILAAGIGGLALPRARRALHSIHVAEQRVGRQRKRIYGAAARAAVDPGRAAERGRRRSVNGAPNGRPARPVSSASTREPTPSLR